MHTLAITVWHFRMLWRISSIIREANSLPRSRATFNSIILLLCLRWYLTEVEYISAWLFQIQMSSDCDKPPRGGRKCKWRICTILFSGSNREMKIFMGEVIPSSKPPSASPPVFSHPSLHVDVKSQLWGAQTQTMWSLRGPSEAFPPLSSQSAGHFLFV